MNIVYAGQPLPEPTVGSVVENSIFFAGPTPRSKSVKSWRPGALEILRELGFAGSVFVPETGDWGWCQNYEIQVSWEWSALGRAACVLFWVPRDLNDLPGFTTNVEFGFMMGLAPERCVLGAPLGVEKMRYMRTLAAQICTFRRSFDPACEPPGVVHQGSDLRACLVLAMERARGVERRVT